jgi:adenine-specific DNA-methyltransferase
VASVGELGALEGGRAVAVERLREARRWSPLTRAPRAVPEGHVELGEICRVHRGAVTGRNSTWVVRAGQADLPDAVLFPSVTRAREIFDAGTALATADHLRLVVDLPPDLDVFDAADRRRIERFLRDARAAGAHDGYIARARRAWWSVGLRSAAPILATYMARRPPAFTRNLAGARHINIAHGLYPRLALSEAVIARLVGGLRGSVSVDDGRTYAGGLTKFEPREMERLPIPNPFLAAGDAA